MGSQLISAYMLIGTLVIALFMPLVSYGEPLDSMSLVTHEGISDTFNTPSLEEQGVAMVTSNQSYKVQVLWEPTEIKPNQIVRFDIKFMNYVTNELVNNVHYDFMVTKDEQPLKEIRNSFAMNGIATHTAEFPSSGSFSVIINVLGNGDFTNPQNESIALDLKVVPEFPLSTMIVMASIVGIMIALTRFTVMNRKRGNINYT